MYNIKKGQTSLELTLLLTFVMVFIGIAIYISSIYVINVSADKESTQAESFADNINKEFEILSEVEDGYYREMLVSEDKYNVNISQSLLILTDKQTNKTYYFDLNGMYNVSLENETFLGQERTYLVLSK